MKLKQLQARESYDSSLKTNLTSLLSLRHPNILIQSFSESAAQHWFRHVLYDVYVPSQFCAEGRAWLARLYGKSPKLNRAVPQWLICQSARLPLFDRAYLRPAFSTNIDLGNAAMIMPGNQRFRLFDFQNHTTLVATKNGFSTDCIKREIEFRGRRDLPDFVLPIRPLGADAYEEPLLDAVPINRLWTKKSEKCAQSQLLHVIQSLAACDQTTVCGAQYAPKLMVLFDVAFAHAQKRFLGLDPSALNRPFKFANACIASISEISLSRSHGDFQPGNVLLDSDDRLNLIDWEDTDIRTASYDAMVYCLGARNPGGLAERVHNFLNNCDPLPEYLAIFGLTRRELVSLWLCEDLIWRINSSSRAGIRTLPPELGHYFREILRVNLN